MNLSRRALLGLAAGLPFALRADDPPLFFPLS